MIIYTVNASDYECCRIKKAFMSEQKAEAYAQEVRDGNQKLDALMVEYNRRVDEIWERVYDRNGFDGEPLFEELEDWYTEQRKVLDISVDCSYGDEVIFVGELEVEE
jgi:hypothetical protein